MRMIQGSVKILGLEEVPERMCAQVKRSDPNVTFQTNPRHSALPAAREALRFLG
jgi:hypothetical protein